MVPFSKIWTTWSTSFPFAYMGVRCYSGGMDELYEDILSKVFRDLGDGQREKVFIDHSSDPPRAYPTGEMYELITEDRTLKEGEEVVTVTHPEDFTIHRYLRVTGIDKCIIGEAASSLPEPELAKTVSEEAPWKDGLGVMPDGTMAAPEDLWMGSDLARELKD